MYGRRVGVVACGFKVGPSKPLVDRFEVFRAEVVAGDPTVGIFAVRYRFVRAVTTVTRIFPASQSSTPANATLPDGPRTACRWRACLFFSNPPKWDSSVSTEPTNDAPEVSC